MRQVNRDLLRLAVSAAAIGALLVIASAGGSSDRNSRGDTKIRLEGPIIVKAISVARPIACLAVGATEPNEFESVLPVCPSAAAAAPGRTAPSHAVRSVLALAS
jgi:hypothetical protein